MNLSDRQTARRAARRVSAMDAVLADLREAIEGGEFAVGDKLPSESVLSTEFEVSRPVVREALRALQALGMTASHTGKGTFVVSAHPVESPTFGGYTARDLLEVRRHVEVPAAGYAAKRRKPAELRELERLVDRMDVEQDDTAWVVLDAQFHVAVAHASQNPVFGKVIEGIREALAGQSSFLNRLGGRRERSSREHRAILAAIRAAEHDAATAAMTEHLDHVDQSLRAIQQGGL
jgi:DNA-binding FadR family transcriptional regulator